MKSKFLNSVVPIIKTENPVGVISYLDYELQEELETGDNIKGMQIIGLVSKSKSVEIPLKSINGKISKNQITDLKHFGIDSVNVLKDSLINQVETEIIKQTVDTIVNSATQINEPKQTKWFNKLLQKIGVKFYSYVQNENELAVKLMVLSNMLATSTRRGPATFAIVSHNVGSLLMESPRFTYAAISDGSDSHIGSGITLIGVVANIKIFRSDVFDKNEIVVGRCGSPDEPGFKAIMSEIKTETIENIDDVIVRSNIRFNLVDVGDVSKLYLKDSFKIGIKPKWQQILKG